MKLNRREFIAGAAALTCTARYAFSNALGLPLAIQLYSVRQQMAQDLDMALSGVAAAGFTVVESAALPAKSAKEIRAALDKAGLHCVSSHHGYNDLAQDFDEVLDFDTQLGSKYIICSSPGHRTPPAAGQQTLTLDDWRFNAEKFNELGEKLAKHGIQFGYHNHVDEFKVTDGMTPYEELLKLTDPKKVTFELDCGWVRVAGHDPVALMQKHPHRFSMLHVKDFHLAPAGHPTVTELGRGDIDYKPLIAQARKNQTIRHAFVEQEEFDMPWLESLKIDASYMRSLS